MALLISKNATVLGDINLSQLYLRLTVNYGPTGENLYVNVEPYASKVAYDTNNLNNKFYVEGVSDTYGLPYDRTSDGADILTFAHNGIKTILSTDIMGENIYLDPSTGEETITPFIDIPKFAEDSSISIVDI